MPSLDSRGSFDRSATACSAALMAAATSATSAGICDAPPRPSWRGDDTGDERASAQEDLEDIEEGPQLLLRLGSREPNALRVAHDGPSPHRPAQPPHTP